MASGIVLPVEKELLLLLHDSGELLKAYSPKLKWSSVVNIFTTNNLYFFL